MAQHLFIALLAGAASALFSGVLTPGSTLLAVLFLAAPLPLVLAGLGWHPLTGALAGLVGCVLISFAVRPEVALAYGAMVALPAYGVVALGLRRLAVLGITPASRGRFLGLVLLGLIFYSAAVSVGVAAIIEPDYDAFRAQLTSGFEALALQMGLQERLQDGLPQDPGPEGGARAEKGLTPYAIMASLMLPMLAFALLIMHVLSLAFALGLAERAQRLGPEKPDLALTRLPPGALIITGLAGFLTASPGYLGAFAGGVLAGLLVAYTLTGLAVLYVRTRGRPMRGLVIALAWAAVVIVGFPAAFFAGVGLVDHLFDLRKSPRPPPSRQT